MEPNSMRCSGFVTFQGTSRSCPERILNLSQVEPKKKDAESFLAFSSARFHFSVACSNISHCIYQRDRLQVLLSLAHDLQLGTLIYSLW